ncbi:MAG: phenylalanine--tRNA ligase subunit beta, partial [Patescibacteria group bacterium]|nr:phenylalanine--tRNA ligase subunit beta [Patescibacteria group bacterium]
MKYSINWLQRYIDLSDQDPDQIADLITRRVAEIEGVEKIGVPETVVIGQILEIEKHPQADRLSVTVVDIGKKKLIIVCGAPNIKVGQKVPVALVGTKLPNGMLIESRAVRGIESNGMICAEDELGIGNDHSGIIVLDKKCQIGKKLKDELKLPADTIIEVENKNMTHRPDLFCHRGYARELAVIFNKKYEFPKTEKIKEGSTKLDITVENPQAVHAYMMVKIDNVKVEKSPSWLRDDLNKIGINSINNIVDATNWVMNDMGQPFHAFDAGKVQKIIVRQAKNNEKIFGLDGKEHSLTKDDIVIADEKKVLDLAGIIGGKESAISDSTTSIILESANFNSTMIRKTAQRLGLRTDAVTRFEKGLDPNLAEDGLNQLVALILKLSPKAKVSSKVFQEKNFEPVEKKVSFSLAKLENRIGYPLKLAGVKRILTILGFEVSQ